METLLRSQVKRFSRDFFLVPWTKDKKPQILKVILSILILTMESHWNLKSVAKLEFYFLTESQLAFKAHITLVEWILTFKGPLNLGFDLN